LKEGLKDGLKEAILLDVQFRIYII